MELNDMTFEDFFPQKKDTLLKCPFFKTTKIGNNLSKLLNYCLHSLIQQEAAFRLIIIFFQDTVKVFPPY